MPRPAGDKPLMTDYDAQSIRNLVKRWGFDAVLLELIRMTGAFSQDGRQRAPTPKGGTWAKVRAALKTAHFEYNGRNS